MSSRRAERQIRHAPDGQHHRRLIGRRPQGCSLDHQLLITRHIAQVVSGQEITTPHDSRVAARAESFYTCQSNSLIPAGDFLTLVVEFARH